MGLLTRKKGAAADAAALPAEVLAVLDEATIHQRHSGDTPRAIVQLEGLSGFIAGPESSLAAVKKLWPWLTEDEAERAARYLGAHVRNHFRQAEPRRTNWATRW